MHRFKKLEVYQKALIFTKKVYKFCNSLPKEEQFGIISQLKRATTSIVLNIAEGAGAGSNMEFKRFLRMSLRSGYEVNSIFDIIEMLEYGKRVETEDLQKDLDEVSAMTAGLIKSLNV
jgi:four helix bundle protein